MQRFSLATSMSIEKHRLFNGSASATIQATIKDGKHRQTSCTANDTGCHDAFSKITRNIYVFARSLWALGNKIIVLHNQKKFSSALQLRWQHQRRIQFYAHLKYGRCDLTTWVRVVDFSWCYFQIRTKFLSEEIFCWAPLLSAGSSKPSEEK